MYIKTPDRYMGRGGRRRFLSIKRLLFWAVSIFLIVVGVGIYDNRDMLQDDVNRWVDNALGDVSEGINRARATDVPPTADVTVDLQRAEEAWRRGAIQESTALYASAIDSTPNDLNAHYKLALGLIMAGEFDAALDAAESTITARPFSPDSWSIRAMALNRLDRHGEAVASSLQALSLVPEERVAEEPMMGASRARALAFLGEAYLNLGQVERAQAQIEAALALNPDSFEALQVSGMINWTGIFDLDAALVDLRGAYDVAPNMIYVGVWLARLENAAFDNEEAAIAIYEDILELNPDNTLVLFDLGDFYLRDEGNFNESLSYLTRCVEADPTADDCYYLMGRAQIALEQIIDAQSSFQTAINLSDEENGYYTYWLAESYIRLGQCPQAMPLLQSGYRFSQLQGDTILIDSFEASLSECGNPVNPPTSTPDPESEASSDA